MIEKFSGIDYSITGPSIAVFETNKEFKFENIQFYFLTKVKKESKTFLNNVHGESFPKYEHDEERFDLISDWALDKIQGSDCVGLEGYSMGSKGKVFNLAENCGLLKHKMYKNDIEFELYPPTVIKKFATGKGNANKEKMLQAFIEETGIDIQKEIAPDKKLGSPVTDIVDAYYMLKYCYG